MTAQTSNSKSAAENSAEHVGNNPPITHLGYQALAGYQQFAKSNVDMFMDTARVMGESLRSVAEIYSSERSAAAERMKADVASFRAIGSPSDALKLQKAITIRNCHAAAAFAASNASVMLEFASNVSVPLGKRIAPTLNSPPD